MPWRHPRVGRPVRPALRHRRRWTRKRSPGVHLSVTTTPTTVRGRSLDSATARSGREIEGDGRMTKLVKAALAVLVWMAKRFHWSVLTRKDCWWISKNCSDAISKKSSFRVMSRMRASARSQLKMAATIQAATHGQITGTVTTRAGIPRLKAVMAEARGRGHDGQHKP